MNRASCLVLSDTHQIGHTYIYVYLELPAAEISAATHCGGNSRRIPENQQPKQKRRNTVCFPGISAAFPPHSAAFPPISAANRGVEKTENKFCRNYKKKKKTPQIRKKCRKSKKAPFLICGRNFCRNEALGIPATPWGVNFLEFQKKHTF